ncbi:exodeoxyribonuclease V beta subunit [Methylomarinovum tepidoasis]|uniref:RecBCD enzyme subunit RecB n=1 Tax=Methylomarinovum tepidoasis TaxID=2840183 RepID=A0AAU9CFF1_9GAMM|nr:exodeoxyribonuclease V subunit beta [Methylomarinovum sp. IN45]BCX88958.1 exodeoxyribonuclease V beta subunit [Methylomarinovum sp. IN45]
MKPLTTDTLFELPLAGTTLIEASAGTGKTYTLANLYLRHIAAGRQPRDILVVTFTNAATEELRGRIRLRLYQALAWLRDGEENDDAALSRFAAGLEDRDLTIRRLTLALQSMDEAAIYTIHGFCQRALEEFAFLSGQLFAMEIGEDEALRQQALADWWRRTLYPLEVETAALIERAVGGFERFCQTMKALDRPEPPQLDPAPQPLAQIRKTLPKLRAQLATLAGQWPGVKGKICRQLSDCPALKRNGGYKQAALEQAFEQLEAFFRNPGIDSVPDKLELLTPQKLKSSLKKNAGPAPQDPFLDACGIFWKTYQEIQADLAHSCFHDALQYVREQTAEAKRRQGLRTFDDLLTGLDQALADAPQLAGHLAERFPVAMVDEFQDTDPIQYRIFRRIYRDRDDICLTLIGDPKQAIYSFRDADLFIYLRAKAEIPKENRWTLVTNWRSTPGLIEAVNRFFQITENPFLDENIPFIAAEPAPQRHRHLIRNGQPPVTVWQLPWDETEKPKPLNLDEARDRVARAVAAEIAALLAEGEAKTTKLGDDPVQAGDVAVLVPTSREGARIKRALAALGIPAVLISRDSVWESEEAEGLVQLLEAVAAPEDRRLARRALASPLLGLTLEEIGRRLADERGWAEWVETLETTRSRWLEQGFLPAFWHLLGRIGLPGRLNRSGDPARRLTNLIHLGELIHQAARTHAGIDACLTWVRRTRAERHGEANELRLEDDEKLVRIATIHAAKGLQYPIVFVPFLFSCRPRKAEGLVLWHDEKGIRRATFEPDKDSEAMRRAEAERLAEDIRLLYVALTRAESALYLAFGPAGTREGHAGRTALARLLSGSDREIKPGKVDPAWLEKLAVSEHIRVLPLPEPEGDAAATRQRRPPPQDLEPARFQRRLERIWQVQSYTAMSEGLPRPPSVPRDEAVTDPALAYPAGPLVGAFLHELLEHLDFAGSLAAQIPALVQRLAPRHGLDPEDMEPGLLDWLEKVAQTPLQPGLTLAGIPLERQLRELSFDFATGPVDPKTLEACLNELEPKGERPPLSLEAFEGLVTGVIDLVFEHEGRYWIADFKSDFLGARLRDYGPKRMGEEIRQRRYDLQYALYTLALHRYLRVRLRDYDYATHFGGVFYLFLRGMRPGKRRYGIFSTRPPRALIERLDTEVFPR